MTMVIGTLHRLHNLLLDDSIKVLEEPSPDAAIGDLLVGRTHALCVACRGSNAFDLSDLEAVIPVRPLASVWSVSETADLQLLAAGDFLRQAALAHGRFDVKAKRVATLRLLWHYAFALAVVEGLGQVRDSDFVHRCLFTAILHPEKPRLSERLGLHERTLRRRLSGMKVYGSHRVAVAARVFSTWETVQSGIATAERAALGAGYGTLAAMNHATARLGLPSVTRLADWPGERLASALSTCLARVENDRFDQIAADRG